MFLITWHYTVATLRYECSALLLVLASVCCAITWPIQFLSHTVSALLLNQHLERVAMRFAPVATQQLFSDRAESTGTRLLPAAAPQLAFAITVLQYRQLSALFPFISTVN